MKNFLLMILMSLVLGITGCSNLNNTKLSTSEMVSHTGKASVALVYYDEENNDDSISDIQVYCSGTWIDETHFLTAHHCVKVAQKEQQRKQDGRESRAEVCEGFRALFKMCDPDEKPEHKVIELQDVSVHYIIEKEVTGLGTEPNAWHLGHLKAWDEKHDLALVETENPPAHDIAKIAEKVPALGEYVMVVGHPKGFYWTYLQGTVAGYREDLPGEEKKSGPYLQLQVPAYYGNSGGGAFDEQGRLIGMADMLVGLPSECIFIPVDPIKDFLKGQSSSKK